MGKELLLPRLLFTKDITLKLTNGRKEHPILFSGPMVKAILEGRKTQTRRVIKPQPDSRPGMDCTRLIFKRRDGVAPLVDTAAEEAGFMCPYGLSGDRLWVRESAYIAPPNFSDADEVDAKHWDYDGKPRLVGYAASMGGESVRCATDYGVKKTPSIHVPRWASRITLEITNVRVERLMDITDEDIRAEGVTEGDGIWDGSLRAAWANGWNAINEKRGYSWLHNPWVWVIEFRKIDNPST